MYMQTLRSYTNASLFIIIIIIVMTFVVLIMFYCFLSTTRDSGMSDWANWVGDFLLV